ncbi:MAG: sigma-54-dependent Fis family transcriptional regulator [Nitrospirae bacterium]|nr:sigma-54-dependent Fis family transcriptional regulator [Nitrospirota bacterium]MBI3351650.1 sigma-54-dependent Fis family transcriptional regulator [Nitrospirota bacterium]
MHNLLIIDDESSIRETLKVALKDRFNLQTAAGGKDGLNLLNEGDIDLVLLDLIMPGMNGIEALKAIRQMKPHLPVIMLTGTSMVKAAVEAIKAGAADYLTKPFDPEELILVIQNALSKHSLEKEVKRLHQEINTVYNFEHLVGISQVMHDIYEKIELLADTKTTVLITGESGTGKELVARALHYNSSRRDKPIIAINCAAIPETLIESELFGHERGAFTDAQGKRIGQFEAAHEGTLFLDEIGDLSLTTQAKILRVIQEKEFMRVGGNQTIKSDVRLITATNKNLEEEVKKGNFRSDLYYRINVVPLFLPSLRERKEDIGLLVKHFIRKKAAEEKKPVKEIAPDALASLIQYDWPGNVRELENIISRVYTLSSGSTITPNDIPETCRSSVKSMPLTQGHSSGEINFEQAVKEFEKDLIVKALKKNHYVQTRAAQMLGISRRMLAYKLQILGVSIDQIAAKDN